MDFDKLITNGEIIDGTGKLRYKADIGIRSGKIKAIANLEHCDAKHVIDATGLIIAPGFIDIHTHSDLSAIDDPGADSKVHQGVTTEVIGNCAYSPFPVGPEAPHVISKPYDPNFDWDWADLSGWAEFMESNGLSINIAPQVGHASIRKAVGLTDNRPPNPGELKEMRRLISESLEQGAFGFSTGLTTAPSMYAEIDELVALAESLAPYEGAYYATHSRAWGGNHVGSIEEAMEIGQRANVPVQFSHIAIVDPRACGSGEEMVRVIETSRAGGLDATYDVYPYTAGGSGLAQMLPFWVQQGGEQTMLNRIRSPEGREKTLTDMKRGWFVNIPWEFDKIIISDVGSDENQDLVGKSIEQISIEREVEPLETYLDIVDEENNQVGGVFHNRLESDVQYFLSHPLAIIGSDGNSVSPTGPGAEEKPHPRFYGTYPRMLGRYVRERSIMSLEIAIHKMTEMPARRLRLSNRGKITEGFVADLTIFDPNTVTDKATFDNPHQLAKGISFVFVGGTLVIDNGKHTHKRAGRVLRRGE